MKKLFFLLLVIFFTFSSFSQEKLIQRKTESFLKIPFNHFDYNDFLGKVSDSAHTGLKPLHYFEIKSEILLRQYNDLKTGKKSWFGRKLFDEHFFAVTGEDYWFSIDPVVDLRLGKDNLNQASSVFQNSRGIRVEGSLGKQFSFSSTIVENYARFPAYFNRYAHITYPEIVPGFGLNKTEDKTKADYPYASGYIAYKPSKFFFFELGHDMHFIGEGYRSLLLSDNAGVYPYLKVEATFWKVKYTTFWTAFQDLRPEVTVNNVYKKKFAAFHYIDWNATPKLNIGFFESVIWYNENRRGFDVNFLNPLIFFKTVEFESGSGASNSVIGLSARYKFPYHIQAYGQFVLDEMTIDKFFGESGYWGNKFGYQLGLKTYKAFNIPHLFMRLEYNTVRPYTYSHKTIANYGHNYQALAHPWGANFKETLFEIQYRYRRWYAHNTLIYGKKGFDYLGDPLTYGGDIYNYVSSVERGMDVQNLQGNLGKVLFDQWEAGYILNPASHLKIFGGFIWRKTDIDVEIPLVKNETTKYIYFGLKSHLWNDHFDVF